MPKKQPEPEPPIIHSYGYITIARPDAMNFNAQKAVCLAIVSLDGDNLEKIIVDEILLFPFIPKKVAREALSFKAKIIGIDERNYDWIRPAWIEVSNQIIVERPDRRGKLPLLRGVQPEDDPAMRQLTALSELKAEGNYAIAEEIDDPYILAELERYGESIVPEACAGATEIARDQRLIILDNLRRPEPVEDWMGLHRWNWNIEEKNTK